MVLALLSLSRYKRCVLSHMDMPLCHVRAAGHASPAAHACEPDVLVRCTPAGSTTRCGGRARRLFAATTIAIFAASAVLATVPSPSVTAAAAPPRSCRRRGACVYRRRSSPYARAPAPLSSRVRPARVAALCMGFAEGACSAAGLLPGTVLCGVCRRHFLRIPRCCALKARIFSGLAGRHSTS